MNHSTTHYYIQSKKDNTINIVGHGKDKTTGEIFYKFIDKSKAKKLMEDEKKLYPGYEYRIITEKTTITFNLWEK